MLKLKKKFEIKREKNWIIFNFPALDFLIHKIKNNFVILYYTCSGRYSHYNSKICT